MFENMNFDNPCSEYECEDTSLLVAPKRYEWQALKKRNRMKMKKLYSTHVIKANGCGTTMMAIQGGIDFTDCCNWHDAVNLILLL